MITKKSLLPMVLGAATFFSSASFAFTHAHPSQQAGRINHQHPSVMRYNLFNRWMPTRTYVVVHRARHRHSWLHHHHH